MNDYSIPEVDQLLCNVLGLSICPPLIASTVHKLSGGNPFWCKEMALFIHTTGAGKKFYSIVLYCIMYFAVWGVVWYGMVWYGVVWCDVVWHAVTS